MLKTYYFWIGFLFSVVFVTVILFFFGDVDEVFDAVSNVKIPFLFLAILMYFISLWLRGERWKFLLMPIIGKPKKNLLAVVTVGYMANNLLPMRMGEIFRSFYLSMREKISVMSCIGTVLLERVGDVLILCLILFLLGVFGFLLGNDNLVDLFSNIPGGVKTFALAVAMPFVVLLVLLIFVIHNIDTGERILLKITFFLAKKHQKYLVDLYRTFSRGLLVVRDPAVFLKLLLTSVPVWLAEIGVGLLVAEGFGLSDYFTSRVDMFIGIICFTAISNLAGILPSTSGGWGPYDFFGAITLHGFGLDPSIAASFALTVHVVLWLPPTIIGIIILWFDKTSISELITKSRNFRLQLKRYHTER